MNLLCTLILPPVSKGMFMSLELKFYTFFTDGLVRSRNVRK